MSRIQYNSRNVSPGFLLFGLLLLINAFLITTGINNAILDRHEFRQTQTAISVYYMIRDGYTLNYLTPVLGTPWTIPFEFPLFQWIVVFFYNITHVSLDASGRIVSIAFYYLCLPVVYRILRLLEIEKKHVWYILCFVLVNPTLIYWSRTFMIESIALFLSLLYVLYILAALKLFTEKTARFWLLLLAATLCGVLAGMVKVTTFAIYFMMTAIILLQPIVQSYKTKDRDGILKLIAAFFLPVVLPLVAIYCWTKHADHIKSLSFLGRLVTSDSLKRWNFGTLAQRTSPGILLWTSKSASYIPIGALIVVLLSLLFRLKYRKLILFAAIPYFIIFMVFTNLYYAHDYYSYANTIIASVIVGLFFISLFSLPNKVTKLVLSFVPVLLVAGTMSYYFSFYYPHQAKNSTGLIKSVNRIKNMVGKDDVLMVIGIGWSSQIAYYTERKSISMPVEIVDSLDAHPKDLAISVTHLLDKLHPKIDDLILLQDSVTERDKHIITYYNLNPEPIKMKYGTQNCFVFLKK